MKSTIFITMFVMHSMAFAIESGQTVAGGAAAATAVGSGVISYRHFSSADKILVDETSVAYPLKNTKPISERPPLAKDLQAADQVTISYYLNDEKNKALVLKRKSDEISYHEARSYRISDLSYAERENEKLLAKEAIVELGELKKIPANQFLKVALTEIVKSSPQSLDNSLALMKSMSSDGSKILNVARVAEKDVPKKLRITGISSIGEPKTFTDSDISALTKSLRPADQVTVTYYLNEVHNRELTLQRKSEEIAEHLKDSNTQYAYQDRKKAEVLAKQAKEELEALKVITPSKLPKIAVTEVISSSPQSVDKTIVLLKKLAGNEGKIIHISSIPGKVVEQAFKSKMIGGVAAAVSVASILAAGEELIYGKIINDGEENVSARFSSNKNGSKTLPK